jgi:hypothetical protein
MLPVVEARALDFSLGEREAERLNEVKRSASGEARSSGVAGIPVNLWVHQHDVRRHGSAQSNAKTTVAALPTDVSSSMPPPPNEELHDAKARGHTHAALLYHCG